MDVYRLETLLIDGDGVLWRGDRPMPGLDRFFDIVRLRGMRWALLTNNNTRTVDEYLVKLAGYGIEAGAGQIFSSSTATADYLKRRYDPGAAIHVVGSNGVIKTLQGAGFLVSFGEEMPGRDVVAVVAGMDRNLTYDKVKVATGTGDLCGRFGGHEGTEGDDGDDRRPHGDRYPGRAANGYPHDWRTEWCNNP
jgi:4-nitrophenyl phosphatase